MSLIYEADTDGIIARDAAAELNISNVQISKKHQKLAKSLNESDRKSEMEVIKYSM